MIPVKFIDEDDLPLYAMHLLPDEEQDELRDSLRFSGEARRQLGDAFSELSIVAHSVDLETPPVRARERLLAQIAREKKFVPAERVAEPAAPVPVFIDRYTPRESSPLLDEAPVRRSAAARVLPWLGWAAAAAIAVEAGNLYLQGDQLHKQISAGRTELAETELRAENAEAIVQTVKDPVAVHVQLTTADAKPQPQGRASYVAEKGSLVFLASNLPPVEANKTYELWLIPAEGAPVAAGTFRPDAHGFASVVMPELPKGLQAKAFGVTVENAEGSPTPTLPILLKGQPS